MSAFPRFRSLRGNPIGDVLTDNPAPTSRNPRPHPVSQAGRPTSTNATAAASGPRPVPPYPVRLRWLAAGCAPVVLLAAIVLCFLLPTSSETD